MTEKPKVVHITSLDLGILFLMPQLRALQAEGFEVHAMCADGPLVSTFESEGIRMHRIPVTRDLSPLADARLLWELYQFLRRENYAIVHTHTPKIELVGLLAAWLARVPVRLYTNHGLIFLGRSGLSRLLFKTIARTAGMFSQLVLSQSAEDMAILVDQRIYARRKLAFLGNGINLSEFSPEQFTGEQLLRKKIELGIPPHHKVVGMVGRYVWEKGYREFFTAGRAVLRERGDVSFVTVGNVLSSERDPVDFSILSELGIEDRVFVLNSRTDMPALYALMDVLVLPSYREGFPRSLMEAAAMSKPLVASDVSGCRQAVVEGRNGFLVPVKNSEALAAKILLILNEPELANRLGAAGRHLAQEHFNVDNVVARLRDCYREMLEIKVPMVARRQAAKELWQSGDVETSR